MLAFLFALIDPVSKVVKALAEAKVDLAKAQTDQERIHAQERISALEQRRAVLIAEAGSSGGWINSAIRAGFALPFVFYNAKLVVWDKMIGWGATDPLSDELFKVEMACIGFYFLYDITTRITRR